MTTTGNSPVLRRSREESTTNRSSDRCSRVAAEHAHHRAPCSQAFERALHRGIFAVAFQIREERVLPRLSAQRARFDAGEVQALCVEDLEYPTQRPPLVRRR